MYKVNKESKASKVYKAGKASWEIKEQQAPRDIRAGKVLMVSKVI